MSNPFNIHVDIRGQIKGGYRIKVSIKDLGEYLDGFTARRSTRNKSGWWIQPPSFMVGGKWKSMPEYDKNNNFWLEIERLCIEAVENEEILADDISNITDEELTDESISEGLGKALDQLGLNDNDDNSPK